jgi:hypothetical protein
MHRIQEEKVVVDKGTYAERQVKDRRGRKTGSGKPIALG